MSTHGFDFESCFATRAQRMQASEIRELLKLLAEPDIISFAGGIPDPDLFPSEAIADAYRVINQDRSAQASAFQYSVSEGYAPLRQWIAEYMGTLGVPCAAGNILITSGSQQALDFLGRLFLSPGDTALVAAPTYLGALQAFNAYEPRYDTLDLDQLSNSPAGYRERAAVNSGAVKFAYAVPDFSNPTGVTMDLAERKALLKLSRELGIPVIEDGAYTALRFDGDPVAPVLACEIADIGSIDAARTIFCGTFSKTVVPGLRVGWVCAARELIDKLVLIKQASDLHSSTINQMVMHDVATRIFDDHLLILRNTYRERRDAMLSALNAHMPDGVSWQRPHGGMFVWLTLPDDWNAQDILAQSIRQARVAFVPGSAFYADGTGANTARLNFSLADPQMIKDGIARLGKVFQTGSKAE